MIHTYSVQVALSMIWLQVDLFHLNTSWTMVATQENLIIGPVGHGILATITETSYQPNTHHWCKSLLTHLQGVEFCFDDMVPWWKAMATKRHALLPDIKSLQGEGILLHLLRRFQRTMTVLSTRHCISSCRDHFSIMIHPMRDNVAKWHLSLAKTHTQSHPCPSYVTATIQYHVLHNKIGVTRWHGSW